MGLSIGSNPSPNIRFVLVAFFTRIGIEATRFTFLALHDSDAQLASDSPPLCVVAALAALFQLVLEPLSRMRTYLVAAP